MTRIGDILRNAREDKDLTQIEVMKQTGINNKTLSGYENGVAEPDLDTLLMLFRLYEVSADRTFGLKDEREKGYTEYEKELIKEVKQLDDKQRQDLLIVLRTLNDKNSSDAD